MDEETRHIEALAILSSNPDYDLEQNDMLKKDLKFQVQQYVKKRKSEFTRINKNLCLALGVAFNEMMPIFDKKHAELRAK